MGKNSSRSKSRAPVVVITGGSRGIGRATAQRFARKGAHLVLAARDPEALRSAEEECASRGAEVITVPTDVSDEESVQALVDAALAWFGRIDVWVGAASVMAYGSAVGTPSAVFRQLIDTNLMGQVHSARAVLPVFERQGAGTIVFVGSLYSRVTAPYLSAYAASKHGLLGFVKSLSEELGRGIAVRAVLPGTVDTAIYQRAANVTGRRIHALPPVLSPNRVARSIVRAARGGRSVRNVGFLQSAAIPVAAFAPALYDRGIRAYMHRAGLRDAAGDTQGAVLHPTQDPGVVTGGWRSSRVRVGLAAAGFAATLLTVRGLRRLGPA